MAWRNTARFCGAALAVASISAATVRQAQAQDIERVLAGIRLGSKSTTVLAKYGNPNDVVIGDVGIRPTGPGNFQGQGQGNNGNGEQLPGLPGSSGFPGQPPGTGGIGAFGMPNNIPGAPGGPGYPDGDKGGFGGPVPFGGAPGGAPGGFPGFPGQPGAAPYGSGNPDDATGAPGANVGAFGNTFSSFAPQQEVTWIYNRKVSNNLVSYEFLIGPNGDVSQIRVIGYTGAGVKTKRGIGLGSTYKDVVRIYGYPEEHAQYGRILVANYKKNYHLSFQFLNESGQANLLAGGNKVIAITIATVE